MKSGKDFINYFIELSKLLSVQHSKSYELLLKHRRVEKCEFFVFLSTQFEVSLQQKAADIVIKEVVKLSVGKSFFEKIISGSYGFGQKWT